MSVLLEVDGLKKYFPLESAVLGGLFGKPKEFARAVDGISFNIMESEMFGLAGESGCGKTTTAKILTGLLQPTSGTVLLRGRNIFNLSKEELKSFRRTVQMIFQDPLASLNPRMRIREILSLPYTSPIQDKRYSKSEILARIEDLLKEVDLIPVDDYVVRYPHELSGGERQRVAMARAITTRPDLVLADEPVASLDVSIRGKVLMLMKNLQEKYHMSFVMITHDLPVLRSMCKRIAIMYVGKIVEMAPTEKLFDNPRHPYTIALLSAQLIPDPSKTKAAGRVILKGEVPSAYRPPPGCRFHPRCNHASEKCGIEEPKLVKVAEGHYVACDREAN